MKRHLALLILTILSLLQSYAQQCGTDILHQQKLKTDSIYARNDELARQELKQAVKVQKAARVIGSYYGMQATIYTIPVVVHILHTGSAPGTQYNPSDANIQGAIDYVNSIYNGTLPGGEGVGDIGIQFLLATRDPSNNPTNGINRINLGGVPDYVNHGVRLQTTNGITDGQLKSLRWDESLYYNIYVVNKIDSKDGGPGPFVAGYAQYPGYFVHSDGTVMLSSQMLTGRKTLPHEIGHALGLPHPFENSADPSGATCPANADCFTQGDGICDTDPITIPPFVARTGTNPCTSTPYNIYTEHNFMNYTDQFTLFTPDQRTTMLAAMTFPTRASLAASWAIAATYPYTFSNPVAPVCIPVSDPLGTSAGYAGLLGVSVDNRQFSSGLTATDPGYVNKAMSPLHIIPLSQNGNYSLSTDVYSVNEQQVAAYIDFNNDGQFDPGERIAYRDRVTSPGSDITRYSQAFSVPATAVPNTVLRMRVIDELASIYGPYLPVINSGCYNPIYGQAEDFPVFIAGVLPASWRYFKGRKTGTNVPLQWALSNELKNGRFEIERASDGSDYRKIGTVFSVENELKYEYIDHNALLPLYFYRLKQTDGNGHIKYSSTIIVRNDQQQDDQSVRVTNPFKDVIDLGFDQAWSTPARIELMDLNGRKILLRQMPAGQKTLKIDLSNQHLTPGVYMLKVNVGEIVVTKKIIKQ